MSVLEYVLFVALVAMVATGTLLYLGRGGGVPLTSPITLATTWRSAATPAPETLVTTG